MRFALGLCCAALLLAGCMGGVKAKPRVGLGMSHSAEGSFVGADLGEYGPGDVSINVEPFPVKPILIGLGCFAAAGLLVVVMSKRNKV